MWFSRRSKEPDWCPNWPPPPPLPEPPKLPKLIKWTKISNTDYILEYDNARVFRGWSAWWRDHDTGYFVSSKEEVEIVKDYTLIKWGKLDHLRKE